MNFLHCRSAATTVQGRRPSNQDAVADVRLPDGRHLVAVADGMGGHQSGEVASCLAIQVLVSELRGGALLKDAVGAANRSVFDEAGREPSHAGMGTTLVALLRTESTYEIANVGDSRAYRVDQRGIERISRDHSFAEEAASKALMGADEIARSPWRNALTRSIGTQQTVEVDLFGPFGVASQPHTVMLCSDGLYRALSDDAAWHHLVGCSDPAAGARILIDLALRHGSDDNVSVAVVRFEVAAAPRSSGRGGWLAARPVPGSPAPPVATFPASAPPPAAARRELSKTLRSLPKLMRFRRSLSVVFSDNVLFGLCTGILMMWLALRLLGG